MAGFRRSEAKTDARNLRIAVIASRFNAHIVDGLVEGALKTLSAHGADSADVQVIHVPGAWELPLAAHRVAHARVHDAIIALGTVVRGDTPHFDYVCSACATGLSRVALDTGMPVAFGVLTCDTAEQAFARAGAGPDNKGAEAALAAIEMAQLFRHLDL